MDNFDEVTTFKPHFISILPVANLKILKLLTLKLIKTGPFRLAFGKTRTFYD